MNIAQDFNDIELCKLTRAIHNWLTYNSIVSRAELLAESSIRYPLCEYIERQMGLKCELEFDHELFVQKSIDFYWENEQGEDKEINYLELKFVRKDTTSRKETRRVFDDLYRLSYLQKDNAKCYFIMCGDTQLFLQQFKESKALRPKRGRPRKNPISQNGEDNLQLENHVFQDWFSFKEADAEKTIKQEEKKYDDVYNNFKKHYKLIKSDPDFQWRKSFKTRLVEYVDNKNQSIGLWEVYNV